MQSHATESDGRTSTPSPTAFPLPWSTIGIGRPPALAGTDEDASPNRSLKRRAPAPTVHTPRDSVSSASTLPLYHPKRFSLPPAYEIEAYETDEDAGRERGEDPSTTKTQTLTLEKEARDASPESEFGGSASSAASGAGGRTSSAGGVIEEEAAEWDGLLSSLVDEDPLDLLVRRTSQILEAAQGILVSTRSTRAHFSRFLALDDSLAFALRRSVEGADELENGLEDVSARVELYAEGKPEPKPEPWKRRERSNEPLPPVDPRLFLGRTRVAPLARPPRLRTVYLNAESTTIDLPIVTPPTPNLEAEVFAEPEPEELAPPPPPGPPPTTSRIRGVLSRIVDADPPPPSPPTVIPPLPSSPSSRLLSAIAASARPRGSSLSLSLPFAPSRTPSPEPPPNRRSSTSALPPSTPLEVPSIRRASTSSLLTPSPSSSSVLSPSLPTARLFSPIPEDDDASDGPATPATSRAPSPLSRPLSRKSSRSLSLSSASPTPTPSPPRPMLSRHSRKISIASFPAPPQISVPSSSSFLEPRTTRTLTTSSSCSTLNTNEQLVTPTAASFTSASRSVSHPPPSPSASRHPGMGSEDTTKVHARGDLGHRRTASGLKERLEAMRADREETPPVSGEQTQQSGWFSSWR